MKKFVEIINKYGLLIVLFFSLTMVFRTCSSKRAFEVHDTLAKTELTKIDSIVTLTHKTALTQKDVALLNGELVSNITNFLFKLSVNKRMTEDEYNVEMDNFKKSLIEINNKNK